METVAFTVVAAGVLCFGLVSGRLQSTVVTPPMVFLVFGLLISQHALGLVEFHINEALIHTLAELTLVLVLFTDASRIDLRLLAREHNIPIRMLLIGLPITIVLGTLIAARLFTEFSIWEAAVLAVILAPTDAALGQAVVCSPKVPARIRQALNVESGLNDGIVLPILLVVVSLATMEERSGDIGYWARFTGLQLGLGPAVGIAVGYLGGKLVERGSESGWMDHTFQSLSALSLALLAFAGAELVGGNGFIAAFCAGLTLGNASRRICSCLVEFAEAEGQLLTLMIFMILGAVMVPMLAEHLHWTTMAYAVLSLTVIRTLPVAISLIGAHLRPETVTFLGWFGPRGLASILFALLVVEESNIAGKEQILTVALATVVWSIFAHGITASPGVSWYSRRLERHKDRRELEEHCDVCEMPTRGATAIETQSA